MGPQSATPYQQPDIVHRDLHRAYLGQSDEFAELKTMAANGWGESRAYILGLLAHASPPAGAHTVQGKKIWCWSLHDALCNQRAMLKMFPVAQASRHNSNGKHGIDRRVKGMPQQRKFACPPNIHPSYLPQTHVEWNRYETGNSE